jgi:DHA1 family bicyclomycin/chloramphenicol resistance-like MFS transporter
MLKPGTFALTALLAGLTAIGPLSTDMYLASLPDIARSLEATTAQTQLTISAYLAAFAFGQIVYGPLSDRYGRKPVLLCALAIYVAASLGCLFALSIGMLIAARALQAIGGCGGIVLARAIVRDLYSGERAGRELSLMSSVMALAPVFAPITGGTLQTAFGWRATFAALVCAGLAGAAVIFLLLPETLRNRSPEPISISSVLASFGVVIRNPSYLAYVALAASSFGGLFAWISGSPFVLQDLYGLSAFQFGVAFAVGSVGYMTGATLAARFVVRLGLNGTIGLGALATAAGGLTMLASVAFGCTSAMSLVVPMAVYLAGMGMVLPQSFAGAMTPFPERAGAASSLLGFAQQSVAAACGVAVGVTLGKSAWPLVNGVAAMGCVTLALWVISRGVRARAASAAAE